ncbi:MAG TPA: hypothetical protein VN673_03610 [Clostridia bacterium]|nr:hypothetical protein [Clostridia bacterium]
MKNADILIKAAGPEKKLPVTASASVGIEQCSIQATTGAPGSLTLASSAPVIVGPASSDATRWLTLERTHDLVSTHAVRLSETGTDVVRVTIEPSEGVQLSLELRRHAGAIEAQASLHRGDFQLLSRHWGELQQRLQTSGVQLSNLADCSPGNPQFARNSDQGSHDEPSRSAFAEFAFGGSMTESPSRRTGLRKTHQGWETWA